LKTIFICKANPIIKNEPVDDATIIICNRLPDTTGLEETEQLHKSQAQKIRDVLFNHVAQCTRHQLLILLLQDAQNLYVGAK